MKTRNKNTCFQTPTLCIVVAASRRFAKLFQGASLDYGCSQRTAVQDAGSWKLHREVAYSLQDSRSFLQTNKKQAHMFPNAYAVRCDCAVLAKKPPTSYYLLALPAVSGRQGRSQVMNHLIFFFVFVCCLFGGRLLFGRPLLGQQQMRVGSTGDCSPHGNCLGEIRLPAACLLLEIFHWLWKPEEKADRWPQEFQDGVHVRVLLGLPRCTC